MGYQYVLEKGSKKVVCPSCGEKTYKRYINTETGEYLPDHIGRCDRIINCGRIYQAKDYFSENPSKRPTGNFISKPEPPKPLSYIPDDYVESTLQLDRSNTFINYLKNLFGPVITDYLVKLYQIGTSAKWP